MLESRSLQNRAGKAEKMYHATKWQEMTLTLIVGRANEVDWVNSLPLTYTRAMPRQTWHNKADFKTS